MTRLADVLVVGGGVIGLTCALACAQVGLEVVLIGDGGPSASRAAAGMLCPSFEAPHEGGRAIMAWGREALSAWDGHARSLAEDPRRDLGYRRDGVIGVGYPPGLLKGARVPAPGGIEASSALLIEGEGQVDPARLLPALEQACDAVGVHRVTGRADRLLGEARVEGVSSGGDEVRAGCTVLASGAARLPGVPPLKPVRGRAFLVRSRLVARTVRAPSVYFVPRDDGTLYVGATEEESRARPALLDGLWTEALWLAPSLAGAEILRTFDGVRPGTEDGLPLLGPARGREGLILALGHHRNGVLLSPRTAAQVAQAASAACGASG